MSELHELREQRRDLLRILTDMEGLDLAAIEDVTADIDARLTAAGALLVHAAWLIGSAEAIGVDADTAAEALRVGRELIDRRCGTPSAAPGSEQEDTRRIRGARYAVEEDTDKAIAW